MSHCKELTTALHGAGFDTDSIRLLCKVTNQDILRKTLIDLYLREIETEPDLHSHTNEAIFTFPFKPLPFSPKEWGHIIEKKNAINKKNNYQITDKKAFFVNDCFEAPITAKNPTALLVDHHVGHGDIDEIIRVAEAQMRGCFASTKPRLIFELLGRFWDRFNDINASFIAVPTKISDLAGRFPVILNFNNAKMLALADKVPSLKLPGYFAFCGTPPAGIHA